MKITLEELLKYLPDLAEKTCLSTYEENIEQKSYSIVALYNPNLKDKEHVRMAVAISYEGCTEKSQKKERLINALDTLRLGAEPYGFFA